MATIFRHEKYGYFMPSKYLVSESSLFIFSHNHHYSPFLKTKQQKTASEMDWEGNGDKGAMISAPV